MAASPLAATGDWPIDKDVTDFVARTQQPYARYCFGIASFGLGLGLGLDLDLDRDTRETESTRTLAGFSG
jgi:hypothetical protein